MQNVVISYANGAKYNISVEKITFICYNVKEFIKRKSGAKRMKLLVIVGPTASGKSALAVALAKHFGGEIISADSMQIYKNLDIGTAKPTEEEKQGIPHHLIDFLPLNTSFSCADYTALAHKTITEVSERGKLPILCGGTGLYIDSVIYDNDFSTVPADNEYRTELEKYTNEKLHESLFEVDPVSASKIHKNNRKRVIRALEIYKVSGKPKSFWDENSRTNESRYDYLIIGLNSSDRDYLYDRINRRVDVMIENGLVDEVNNNPIDDEKTAGQAIGYKEIKEYLCGNCSLPDAINNLKQATRNYAKRQLTWFNRNKDIRWIDILNKDFAEVTDEAINLTKDFLKK